MFLDKIQDFIFLSSGPLFAIAGFTAYIVYIKKHYSDNFNQKISNNLFKHEKEMRDRYKL